MYQGDAWIKCETKLRQNWTLTCNLVLSGPVFSSVWSAVCLILPAIPTGFPHLSPGDIQPSCPICHLFYVAYLTLTMDSAPSEKNMTGVCSPGFDLGLNTGNQRASFLFYIRAFVVIYNRLEVEFPTGPQIRSQTTNCPQLRAAQPQCIFLLK